MKPVSGVGLTAVGIGSVLVYAGIKGYSVLAVLENLVTGKPVHTGAKMVQKLTTPTVSGGVSGASGGATTGADSSGGGSAPVGDNQAIGQPMAAAYGWTGSEWDALVTLWNKESNWRNRAKNPSSGAYGIPQSLPHTKMPKAAWPESAGGSSDARAQIDWGLRYIKDRYGKPSAALAFHLRNNWY